MSSFPPKHVYRLTCAQASKNYLKGTKTAYINKILLNIKKKDLFQIHFMCISNLSTSHRSRTDFRKYQTDQVGQLLIQYKYFSCRPFTTELGLNDPKSIITLHFNSYLSFASYSATYVCFSTSNISFCF